MPSSRKRPPQTTRLQTQIKALLIEESQLKSKREELERKLAEKLPSNSC